MTTLKVTCSECGRVEIFKYSRIFSGGMISDIDIVYRRFRRSFWKPTEDFRITAYWERKLQITGAICPRCDGATQITVDLDTILGDWKEGVKC